MKNYLLLLLLFILNVHLIGQNLVKDIRPGNLGSVVEKYVVLDGKVYFTAISGVTGSDGGDFWTSNGTSTGTYLVKEITENNTQARPDNLQVFDGNVFFSGKDSLTSNIVLWKSNGTEQGTKVIGDVNPFFITPMDSIFVFLGSGSQSPGAELWRSNGTSSGTYLLKDIKQNGSSSPHLRIEQNGFVYFNADDGIHGRELWRTDGTEFGTEMVKDISSGSKHSIPDGFKKHNNQLLFYANDSIHGTELWKTDGTEIGTTLLKDIFPGTTSSLPRIFGELNGVSLFMANDSIHGTELWRTDGTEAGTFLLKDIFPGDTSSLHIPLSINANSCIYFAANDGVSGSELWKTDGTIAGTVLVKDVNPGQESGIDLFNTRFEIVEGDLFFTANDGIHGLELWTSNGTESGTFLVDDINPGIGSSTPIYLTAMDNVLFFRANNGINGDEIWKYEVLPLSVELINFSGKRIEENKIILNWITENEVDNLGFVLERSHNLRNWSEIFSVKSKGEGQDFDNSYSYVDDSPLVGSNYYRLKQIDLSGAIQFSSIIEFQIFGLKYSIFPNPIIDRLVVDISDYSLNSNVVIQILSIQEEIVFENEFRTFPTELDLKQLPSGVYLISINVNGKVINELIKKIN